MARSREWVGVLCGVLLMLVGAGSAGAAIVPRPGAFSGTTSQDFNGSVVGFRVSGARISNEIITWHAGCRSGKTLGSTTHVATQLISNGRWSAQGAYDTTISSGVSARAVLGGRGLLTSPISATGVWKVSVTVSHNGTKVDSCRTGTIRWAAGSFATGSPSSEVAPSRQQVGSATYAQWARAGWQWALSHTHVYPSLTSGATRCVSAGQNGPVWFLGGDGDSDSFSTRTCAIPAGRYLLIEGPSAECSSVESAPYHATTSSGLVHCARSFGVPQVNLALDGQVISPAGFPVATGAFPFTMPAADNLLEVPGATSGQAAAFGLPVILRPLPRGRHTVIRVQRFPGGQVGVNTFDLRVG